MAGRGRSGAVEIGCKLSSEEFPPSALVRNARRAEDVGFTFAMISDHYIRGSIARARVGVACLMIRIHPAVVAQAAATAAAMMPGRFVFGVGTRENLNEHILGDHWPAADVRGEMLEEAVEVIRKLWQGGLQDHHGMHYIVENARIDTMLSFYEREILPQFLGAGLERKAS